MAIFYSSVSGQVKEKWTVMKNAMKLRAPKIAFELF